jgi:hypothetical protein
MKGYTTPRPWVRLQFETREQSVDCMVPKWVRDDVLGPYPRVSHSRRYTAQCWLRGHLERINQGQETQP